MGGEGYVFRLGLTSGFLPTHPVRLSSDARTNYPTHHEAQTLPGQWHGVITPWPTVDDRITLPSCFTLLSSFWSFCGCSV